ncbi:MBL fold metallo-hydrolase [Shewanella sp. AS16]|uniref:MBL fold metallo-hydrolase n=1 Tax=Shewanella sp. AS16 TaxID=2907625 RepID=UPI001F2DD5A6|nr:MBL fold metallo-hydrolase [Shewanella sp. AS16]MCE9687871.1 MBL fold metallo-hydrolase [Shewanella sp. AS16]
MLTSHGTQAHRTHVKGSGFRNEAERVDSGAGKLLQILWRYLTTRVVDKTPGKQIPVRRLRLPRQPSTEPALYKISHSTLLLQLRGHYWLTDPVFAERASPSQWVGPKRFHSLPLELADIPPLAGIILSHDHYDHLDKHSIQALDARTGVFIVPLGVDRHLRAWGVAADKIIALDWWQDTTQQGVKFTATPAQHFSGRGLRDGNQTLWASWVIEAAPLKLFFSGDSGYFDGFKRIGDRLGPFDLTLIETGAYDELWADIHMLPEQSLRAHLDLRGRYLMPIHNSSFALALHSWYEPLQRLQAAANAYDVPLLTPEFGQAIALDKLEQSQALDHGWWQRQLPAFAPEPVSIPARA